eukprot:CAMPEP_0184717652 /NCGR_PEP_ID=MMETSP0314-20130426/7049_1 /TAXON_ID=38298 /ORGANISM="Rhodella maculata, Strain CCMP 736" /LENGTH=875 /DNA_ID=CAMNT_0027181243 /DNA_START=59 /DNA_END=2686 /DNA_ORIENTATION=+
MRHYTFVRYIVKREFWTDTISLCSLFTSGIGRATYINLNYLRTYAVYRTFCGIFYSTEFDDVKRSPNAFKNPTRYIVVWCLGIATILLQIAWTAYTLESLGGDEGFKYNPDGTVNWHQMTSLYFMVVSLSTVGYGDFVTETILGRIVTGIVILTILFYIGGLLGRIVEVASSSQEGEGSYLKNLQKGFVVIVGDPTCEEFRYFVDGFYSHKCNRETELIILVEKLRWTIQEYYTLKNELAACNRRLKLIRGSPVNVDRKRLDLTRATGIVSMSGENFNETLLKGDIFSTISTISQILRDDNVEMPFILSYDNPDSIFIINYAIEQEYLGPSDQTGTKSIACKDLASEDSMDIGQGGSTWKRNAFCQSTLLSGITALNIVCPGASTLLWNLFRGDHKVPSSDKVWLNEYLSGASQTFFNWRPPSALKMKGHVSFYSMIRFLQSEFQLVLMNISKTGNWISHDSEFDFDIEYIVMGSQHSIEEANKHFSSPDMEIPHVEPDMKSANVNPRTFHSFNSDWKPGADDSSGNHIILAVYRNDSAREVGQIIKRLKSMMRKLRFTVPIVVLADEPAPEYQIGGLVHFVKGKAMRSKDIKFAGIENARCLVLFDDTFHSKSFSEDGLFSEYGSDLTEALPSLTLLNADNLMGGKMTCRILSFSQGKSAGTNFTLKRPMMKHMLLGFPFLDLQNVFTQSAAVIWDDTFEETPETLFAAGEYQKPFTGIILAKQYKVPGVLKVMRMLVGNEEDGRYDNPSLYLVPVPPVFYGDSYAALFEDFLNLGVLCLGLYRSGSTVEDSSPLPWVFTNPHKSVELRELDGVYIVAKNVHQFRLALSKCEGGTLENSYQLRKSGVDNHIESLDKSHEKQGLKKRLRFPGKAK